MFNEEIINVMESLVITEDELEETITYDLLADILTNGDELEFENEL